VGRIIFTSDDADPPALPEVLSEPNHQLLRHVVLLAEKILMESKAASVRTRATATTHNKNNNSNTKNPKM
jgi:hypothetical protein